MSCPRREVGKIEDIEPRPSKRGLVTAELVLGDSGVRHLAVLGIADKGAWVSVLWGWFQFRNNQDLAGQPTSGFQDKTLKTQNRIRLDVVGKALVGSDIQDSAFSE